MSPLNSTGYDDSPSWSHQRPDDPLSALSRAANIADFKLALACTPALHADVENHAARLSVRLGLSRGQCLMLCDVGLMLNRMPKLAAFAESSEVVPLRYLSIIANGTAAIEDGQMPGIERHILDLLKPRRHQQGFIGPRTLARKVGDIVVEYDNRARNDGTTVPPPSSEALTCEDAGDGQHCFLSGLLERDRATELFAAIKVVKAQEIAQGRECTIPDALMHIVRGNVDAQVVINVYRHENGGPAYLDGAGWLNDVATQEWIDRATHIRLSGDSCSQSYSPTAAQVARVRGRDGTCRFPGCDVPAQQCDIDHIAPYNHDDPAKGGPTDTGNLHCLCRKHHNLKTHKLWDVTSHADHTETWASHDGITARSIPSGPLAGIGRQTFDQRATRKTATIRRRFVEWIISEFSDAAPQPATSPP
ncbi:HNH endonuclease signature motif containing protein [Corynebacterium sp. H78]|uniref:HNH endonuclease signature motif containing protein n=1 Tax=Corynebacterium sp. H78 TaxID=3133417 RepID=UPI0030B40E24